MLGFPPGTAILAADIPIARQRVLQSPLGAMAAVRLLHAEFVVLHRLAQPVGGLPGADIAIAIRSGSGVLDVDVIRP